MAPWQFGGGSTFIPPDRGYDAHRRQHHLPSLLPNEERVVAVHLGLDLAQAVDFTALATVEVFERLRQSAWLGWSEETCYRVRDLQRLPHGVAYDEQARLLVAYLAELYRQQIAGTVAPTQHIELYVDATGVGRPVVDLLRRALLDEPRTLRVNVWPLTFRHGEGFDKYGASTGGASGMGYVGKTHLVSSLQALLATGRLELPAEHPLLATTVEELQAYRIKIDQSTGMESLGGVGAHDDLVTALALACLDDPRRYLVTAGPSLWE